MESNRQTQTATKTQAPKHLRAILSRKIKPTSLSADAATNDHPDSNYRVPEKIIEHVRQSKYSEGYILATLMLTNETRAANSARAMKALIASRDEFLRVTTDTVYMACYLDNYWPAEINYDLSLSKAKPSTASNSFSGEATCSSAAALDKKHRRKQARPKAAPVIEVEVVKRVNDATMIEQPITLSETIRTALKRPAPASILNINIYSTICLYCSKFFCDASKFVHHLCYCSICDVPYHRGIIDQHYQRVHRDNVTKCAVCFKHFILDTHLLQHHKHEHCRGK